MTPVTTNSTKNSIINVSQKLLLRQILALFVYHLVLKMRTVVDFFKNNLNDWYNIYMYKAPKRSLGVMVPSRLFLS